MYFTLKSLRVSCSNGANAPFLYLKVHGFIHKTSFTYTKHCVTAEQLHLHFIPGIKPGFFLLLQTTLTPAGELLSTSESTSLSCIKHFSTRQWTDSIHWLIMPCVCSIAWLLKNPMNFREDLTSHKLLEKMWCSSCNDVLFLLKVLASVPIKINRRAHKSAFSLIPKVKTMW